ncbi:GNAT family N-acetyltransferase [archaeon]|nr:GNAT family N-acetyltransferase [archaeon]MCK9439463.1 GNAT family N-acetyltransferase [Patescibacteria group bacterium]
MKMLVKEVPIKDINEVIDLFDYCINNANGLASPYDDGEIENYLKTKRLYGAYYYEKLIGVGALLDINYDPIPIEKVFLRIIHKKTAMLVRYFVYPKYRNLGVMTKIQDRLINLANQFKYEVVIANAFSHNIASIKVIEKRLKLSYNLNVLGDDTLIFMLDLE